MRKDTLPKLTEAALIILAFLCLSFIFVFLSNSYLVAFSISLLIISFFLLTTSIEIFYASWKFLVAMVILFVGGGIAGSFLFDWKLIDASLISLFMASLLTFIFVMFLLLNK